MHTRDQRAGGDEEPPVGLRVLGRVIFGVLLPISALIVGRQFEDAATFAHASGPTAAVLSVPVFQLLSLIAPLRPDRQVLGGLAYLEGLRTATCVAFGLRLLPFQAMGPSASSPSPSQRWARGEASWP